MSSISGVGGYRPPPPKPPSFEKIDANSDGAVSLAEFKSGAPKGADDSKAEKLFKTIDSDSSGSISKEETETFKAQAEKADQQLQSFLFSLQSSQPAQGTTKAADEDEDDILAKLDSNADGSVAKDEFLKAVAGSQQDETGADDLLSKLFDAIDSDKDGAVSKNEMAALKEALSRRGPPPPPPGPPPAALQAYDQTTQLGNAAATGSSYSKAA